MRNTDVLVCTEMDFDGEIRYPLISFNFDNLFDFLGLRKDFFFSMYIVSSGVSVWFCSRRYIYLAVWSFVYFRQGKWHHLSITWLVRILIIFANSEFMSTTLIIFFSSLWKTLLWNILHRVIFYGWNGWAWIKTFPSVSVLSLYLIIFCQSRSRRF